MGALQRVRRLSTTVPAAVVAVVAFAADGAAEPTLARDAGGYGPPAPIAATAGEVVSGDIVRDVGPVEISHEGEAETLSAARLPAVREPGHPSADTAVPEREEPVAALPALPIPDSDVARAIADRVERAGKRLTIAERSADAHALRELYRSRAYEPMWLDGDEPTDRASALQAAIADAGAHGLRPERYTLADTTTPDGTDNDTLADWDLLYSITLLRYGVDVHTGQVRSGKVNRSVDHGRTAVDPLVILRDAAASDDLTAYLAGLAPRNPSYRGLQEALRQYRSAAAAGGWSPLPNGPTLKPGMSDRRVPALRAQLGAMGLLENEDGDSPVYDSDLVLAVEQFQHRHGLATDGVVGPKTRAALSVTAPERVQQIIVNMDRWRWMPADLGQNHVFVNLAAFELNAVEDGEAALTMRVVVGKRRRQTPSFSDEISYLDFNPYWHVPYSIATRDILPKARRNPGYLANSGIRVLVGGRQISPWDVNWDNVGRGNFPFRFRQDPGRRNALGRVKFMFPNRHSVYLHDTPSKGLFARSARAYSSGCVRVERPFDLAQWLLRDEGWSRERIDGLVSRSRNRVVRLSDPVPVHLAYFTAFVDGDGVVQFREDLYGHDARHAKALFGATH